MPTIIPASGGKWHLNRWSKEATIVRGHGVGDGALESAFIPWVWTFGIFPWTVTIEGEFTGSVWVITSSRARQLQGELMGNPTEHTGENGSIFPRLSQEITGPARISSLAPDNWVGLYLPSPITGGEMSAFFQGVQGPGT